MSRAGIFKLVLWLAATGPALAGWRIDGLARGGWSIDGNGQGGGGTGEVAFAASDRLWVDWRNDTGIEDGSIYRPYATIQAAFDHVGSATSAGDYTTGVQYVEFEIAAGEYREDVTVPFRPSVRVSMSGVRLTGDITRPIYAKSRHALVPRLLLAGGVIDGDLNVVTAGDWERNPETGWYGFYRTDIERAAVIGAINIVHGGVSDETGFLPQDTFLWHQLFLDHAHANAIDSPALPDNDGYGYAVTLYVQGWHKGPHYGVPADGWAVGQVSGTVLPYSLASTRIHGLSVNKRRGDVIATGKWHNVTFDTGTYQATNVNMAVRLDTASYNSWLAATTEPARGPWHADGGLMTLEDPWGGFAGGDRLHGDGTNLFYVRDNGTVIQITGNE